MARQDDLVIDVGANLGLDTAAYLAQGYRVVAIEPIPSLAALLRETFRTQIDAQRAEVLEVAVGHTSGRTTFYVSRESTVYSSLTQKHAAREGGVEEIEVEVVTLAEVLARCGVPHYLKVDTEGGEQAALEGLRGRASGDLPRYLSAEWGWDGSAEMLPLLTACGYNGFKFVDQGLLPYLTSGPFGEDAAGEWVAPGALALPAATPGHWYDLHGKMGD